MEISLLIYFQFNFSIQNSLFSTQHIVHTTLFFAYDVLKRERAEDRAYMWARGKREKMYQKNFGKH